MTNDGDYEELAREAGKVSGDMTFPLVYTPELHFCEFESAVADMKNSVKNGDNAQSSCAGLFINANLGFDYPGVWLHVDMAFPVEHSVRFLKFSFLFLFFRIRITRHPLARDCLSMQILALIILEFSSILIWPNL